MSARLPSKPKPKAKAPTKKAPAKKASPARKEGATIMASVRLPAPAKPGLFQQVKKVLAPKSASPQAAALADVREQVMHHLSHPAAPATAPFQRPLLTPPPLKRRPWLWPLLALAALALVVYLGGRTPTPPHTTQVTFHPVENPNTALTIGALKETSRTSTSLVFTTTVSNISNTPFSRIRLGFLVADAAGRPLKAISTDVEGTLPPHAQVTHTFTTVLNPASPQRFLLTLPLTAFQVQPLVLSAVPTP